jgi:hypothetical protein
VVSRQRPVPRTTSRFAVQAAALAAGLTASMLVSPEAALACTVCYGSAADPVIEGTRWSIVFLLALTYLLLGAGATLFLLARRRSLGSRKLP